MDDVCLARSLESENKRGNENESEEGRDKGWTMYAWQEDLKVKVNKDEIKIKSGRCMLGEKHRSTSDHHCSYCLMLDPTGLRRKSLNNSCCSNNRFFQMKKHTNILVLLDQCL